METGTRDDREISRRGGRRPHHQSDDCRRPGAWRRRAGHRQRAAGGNHLRRERRHPHRQCSPTTCRRPRAKFRRSSCITWKRRARHSITKAKGLGEGGTIGAPAAVINAINDALTPFGVAIDEMPATPQRIRAALRAGRGKVGMSEKTDITLDHQRPRPRDRGRAAAHAGRCDPRGLRADRHPYRLRARHLRRLHRDRRRRAGALVPDVRRAGGRQDKSAPSRGWRTATSCIRCSRPSWTITACNAASARRAF